ncbi:T-cell surface antigen CD2-like isoform X1 [Cyclopterus lumpus]|uniref:T-cell surface antigen CD2-like isoform X1 n=1 Tax=Cyclopterus lumpus TaxID=8103 RepID=UPI0014874EE9|nr:T-cell surface antigen CD2-like isoform X1 [Cyclopterus lumpus]
MRRRMKVKMASVSSVSLLLLCCSAISSAGSKETCDLYAATGADFTVPVVAAVHRMDTLIWKHDGELIFSRRKESTFLKGRKEDVSEDGSLKLTNVQKSHEGSYVSEVFDTDGKKKGPFEAKHLCVMHGVPTPSVTSTCNASSKVTFTCKVTPKDKDLRFAWLQNDKVLEKEKGPILTTSLDLVKTDPISCKVSNLASSVTSAPVTHDCKANTSFLPETLLGINTWIFVGTGGGVVLVLIVVVVVCCVCTKRRKRLRLKGDVLFIVALTCGKINLDVYLCFIYCDCAFIFLTPQKRGSFAWRGPMTRSHIVILQVNTLIIFISTPSSRPATPGLASIVTEPPTTPTPTLALSPAPEDLHRPRDHPVRLTKSSRLLFLSPGKTLPRRHECDSA